MASQVHCRIDAIQAREAPLAVIFRRGPSRYVQMLRWNLETDEIESGQWLRARVYTPRCDVSPDGQHVIIAATDYAGGDRRLPAFAYDTEPPKELRRGWTAVSRAPYFTALAIWFTGCAWNGGGLWKSNSRLGLNTCRFGWLQGVSPPSQIETFDLVYGQGENEPAFTQRLIEAGWVQEQELESEVLNRGPAQQARAELLELRANTKIDPEDIAAITELAKKVSELSRQATPIWNIHLPDVLRKSFGGGALERVIGVPDTDSFLESWRLLDDSGRVVREWKPKQFEPQWLDVDHRGRVIFAENGSLWSWASFPDGSPSIVANLDDHNVETLETPHWAKEWAL